MALTKDDLRAIASLMDEKMDVKLKPVNEKLDSMDKRLEYVEMKQDLMHKQLETLTFDMKASERAIKKDILLLKDRQETLIAVLQGKGLLNIATY